MQSGHFGLHRVAFWSFADNALSRTYTFAGFPTAVAFVQSLVRDCENDDHHPDVTINYRRVNHQRPLLSVCCVTSSAMTIDSRH